MGQGYVPPDSLVAPQIQKLADHSDVISEVPKYSKFRGSAPDRAGVLTALSAPSQEPHHTRSSSGLVFTGLKV